MPELLMILLKQILIDCCTSIKIIFLQIQCLQLRLPVVCICYCNFFIEVLLKAKVGDDAVSKEFSPFKCSALLLLSVFTAFIFAVKVILASEKSGFKETIIDWEFLKAPPVLDIIISVILNPF